jgi:serine/threonine protein kinase/Flp pilus assembly protein TadD
VVQAGLGETVGPQAERTAESGERAISLDFLAAPTSPNELGWLGHYRVLKLLGRGGMGAVFKAEDIHLQRTVALKVILPEFAADPEARLRFFREAQACAALRNVHVVTIYQVGLVNEIPVLAMEFLEGQSLQERLIQSGHLPVAEVLRIGREIATGLAAAHAQGMIHRDIKPANVWLEAPQGTVKLLDFGLARPPGARSQLTETGKIIGTPEFMSPEQARGLELDARSDLFSLGAVLYALCSGQVPFQGTDAMAVLMATALDAPVPIRDRNPDVPPALAELIERLLAKAPADRPASSIEVVEALAAMEAGLPLPPPKQQAPATQNRVLSRPVTGLGSPTKPPVSIESPPRSRRPLVVGAAIGILGLALIAGVIYRLTRPTATPETGKAATEDSLVIAVLPFINTESDPDTEYLRDGIPGALLKRLSEIKQLTLRPYSSGSKKPDEEINLPEAGRQLDAQTVLSGRVRQGKGRLFINVQLVDVRANRVVWVESYERRPADLQDIETDIAQQICAKLGVSLSRQEEKRLSRRDTVNADAYQLYLQGRYHQSQSTLEGMKKSLACFKQAIAKDPNYALAYAGLADAYGYYAGDWMRYEEALPQQKTAARKALDLNDELAETHLAMGNVYMGQDYDWLAAETEFKRAIALKPKLDLAHDAYAQLLAFQGRFDEAIAQQQEALKINPFSTSLIVNLSYLYYLQRQYDLALEQARKALEIDPNFVVAHDYLGAAYLQKKQYAEALAEFRTCRQLDEVPWYLARLAAAEAVAGNTGTARTLLQELEALASKRYVTPECRFLVYVGLNDKDRAFEWLEKMVDVRSQYPLRLEVQPDFDNLRADPRYAEWLRRLKLTR